MSGTPRSIVETDDPEVRDLVRHRAATAELAIGLQLSAARYLDDAACPRIFEEAEPRQIEGLIAHATTLPQRLRRRLTWWKHARYLARLAASMAAVTVVSEAEREAMVATGVDAATVHVVPNGADGDDLARPRAVAAPPRLIYPGAITYAPNLEAVVWCLNQVMPRVRAVRPDVQLWVTGDTGDLPLDRMPNRDMVRFTGRLPDVKDAISGSAATVVPLQVGGGTRLKVLESLALGTPVVSTTTRRGRARRRRRHARAARRHRRGLQRPGAAAARRSGAGRSAVGGGTRARRRGLHLDGDRPAAAGDRGRSERRYHDGDAQRFLPRSALAGDPPRARRRPGLPGGGHACRIWSGSCARPRAASTPA